MPEIKSLTCTNLIRCSALVLICLPLTSKVIAQPLLQFDAPTEWLKHQQNSPLQVARFDLPRVDGDSEDAELTVNYFNQEEERVEALLERLTNQMLQPDDRPSADVATTTRLEISEMLITVLDVPGIFSALVEPNSKMRYYKKGFRLKVAVIEGPTGPLLFKLIGPERTVVRWEPIFTAFLESVRFE